MANWTGNWRMSPCTWYFTVPLRTLLSVLPPGRRSDIPKSQILGTPPTSSTFWGLMSKCATGGSAVCSACQKSDCQPSYRLYLYLQHQRPGRVISNDGNGSVRYVMPSGGHAVRRLVMFNAARFKYTTSTAQDVLSIVAVMMGTKSRQTHLKAGRDSQGHVDPPKKGLLWAGCTAMYQVRLANGDTPTHRYNHCRAFYQIPLSSKIKDWQVDSNRH